MTGGKEQKWADSIAVLLHTVVLVSRNPSTLATVVSVVGSPIIYTVYYYFTIMNL